MPEPDMHTYRVVERWADESRIALRCDVGRYHLTRALNALPPAGATLHGTEVHLGFGILLCPTSGAIFRVIFESIDHTDPVFERHGIQNT